MLSAMVTAEVGDDVFGEDPTVKLLEAEVAALLNKEAAVFVPSGTMSNQIAIRLQTRPGNEAILESDAHIRHYEAGAAAGLGAGGGAGGEACPAHYRRERVRAAGAAIAGVAGGALSGTEGRGAAPHLLPDA